MSNNSTVTGPALPCSTWTPGSREPSPVIPSSKLAPMVQRTTQVRRSRIIDQTTCASAIRLFLVRAPAGFGKTTVMVQIREALQARGFTTAWLTLDAADNDVPRFLTDLSAALDQIGLERAAPAQNPLSLLAADQAPFALFLDDFEVIREGSVLGLVRELLEHLPRNGQVVIGSRNQPDLGVSRLRVRGQLMELETESLRFQPGEVAEFFRLRGFELSPETIDHALQKTEGWVAALWLLSLALQRSGSSADVISRLSTSESGISEYLTDEVLSRQEPMVREFLLRSSVLHHLSSHVCQALMPHIDCEAMLQALYRRSIFVVPLEGAPDVFRYHSLFADFLRDQLQREYPQEVARLNLAASGWYESQQRPVPAIDHAIAGGDYPHALSLLERHAYGLLEQGRMRLLNRWFTAIPHEMLRQRHHLYVIAIWARCFSLGPWTAMKWLQHSGCLSNDDRQVQDHVLALTPVLMVMMDRYEDAHEAGRRGLARLPTGNGFVDGVLLNVMAHVVSVIGERKEAHRLLDDARRAQVNGAFNRMYTETVEGMLDMRDGRLRHATARFRMAVTASPGAMAYNYSQGNAWAGVPYVSVLYETNDLGTAERLLNVYLPLVRDVGLPDHMISSYRLRARLAFLRGDVDTAFRTLTELEYFGHQRELRRVTASAKLERSRLLALQGHAAAARDELERSVALDALRAGVRPDQDVEDSFIGRMRIDLQFGDPEILIEPLQTEWQAAQKSGRRHRALKLRLLLAIAAQRSGDNGRAVREAHPLLQEACREGFVRLLLDEGAIVAPLLRRMQTVLVESVRDPILQEYVLRLVELLGSAGVEDNHNPDQFAAEPTEPLTRKEIRVLQLLAEGYSNSAMAEKLFVSDSTVRTHLRNISMKLNSRSRTQAVAIARRLGIIA